MSLGLGNIIVQQKSSGGGGAGNLQAVTDIGNTTTNDIELLYPNEGTVSLNFRNVNNVVGVNKATLEIDTSEYLQLKYNIYGAVATTLGIQFSSDQRILTYQGGNFVGVHLDFSAQYYALGDINNVITGTALAVNVFDEYVVTYIQGVQFGLEADAFGATLGDVSSNKNQTTFRVNDNQQRIELSPNLITTSAGSNVTQHLSIYVSGVHYKIQLKNP